mgnify:CR=1 FL=1
MNDVILQKRIDKTIEYLENKLGYKPIKLQNIELDAERNPYKKILDWKDAVRLRDDRWVLYYNAYTKSTQKIDLLEV